MNDQQCFATRGQATAYATGDSSYSSMSDSQVDQKLANTAGPAGTSPQTTSGSGKYILGIDYQDTHYNNGSSKGSTLTWYGDRKCASNYSYFAKKMPNGWNDRISSAANYSYSNCGGWDHYENGNYNKDKKGGQIDCGFNGGGGNGNGCYDMHTFSPTEMSDRTSSEHWAQRAKSSGPV